MRYLLLMILMLAIAAPANAAENEVLPAVADSSSEGGGVLWLKMYIGPCGADSPPLVMDEATGRWMDAYAAYSRWWLLCIQARQFAW